MTRDFSLSSVVRRMGGAGGSGYEIGAVLTCHSPSLVMNFPRDKIASGFISQEFTAPR